MAVGGASWLNSGVDEGVIDSSLVGSTGNLLFVIWRLHAKVVAANDDGGIGVKWLLLGPLDEGRDLFGGASMHIVVFRCKLLLTNIFIHPAIGEVGINGQYLQVKWLVGLTEAGSLVAGKLKKLFIFVAPPHLVVLWD